MTTKRTLKTDAPGHEKIRELVRRMIREADGDEPESDASEETPEPAEPRSENDEKASVDNQIDAKLDGFEREHDDETTGFDPEGYALEVFNMIENVESIIEIRDVIVKRAAKRLTEHKSKDEAQAFIDAMRHNHGIALGKADDELDNEMVPPTGAFGGPDMGGGLSGGGGGAPAA